MNWRRAGRTCSRGCLTSFPGLVSIQNSPYEADAQAAFLVIDGQADCALTVDGDLVLYGCPWVIREPASRKHRHTQVLLSDVLTAPVSRDHPDRKWTLDLLQEYGILLGCDYTGHNPGVGRATAETIVSEPNYSFNAALGRLKNITAAQSRLMQLARVTYRFAHPSVCCVSQCAHRVRRVCRHQRVLNRDGQLQSITPYDPEACRQLLGRDVALSAADESFCMGPLLGSDRLGALAEAPFAPEPPLEVPQPLPDRVNVCFSGDDVLRALIKDRDLSELSVKELRKVLSHCNITSAANGLGQLELLALTASVVEAPPQRPQAASHDELLAKTREMIAKGTFDIDTMRQSAVPPAPGLMDPGWRDMTLGTLIAQKVSDTRRLRCRVPNALHRCLCLPWSMHSSTRNAPRALI
jgi:hypothetical protein